MEEKPIFCKTMFLKVHQERDSETRIKVFVLELILKCQGTRLLDLDTRHRKTLEVATKKLTKVCFLNMTLLYCLIYLAHLWKLKRKDEEFGSKRLFKTSVAMWKDSAFETRAWKDT